MATSASAASAAPAAQGGSTAGRDYLVRSEEQLLVDTDRVVAGYARLEKFLVTEIKTITVEVTHEEVRLVQSTAADRPAGPPDPADTGAGPSPDRWLVVSQEEVVVSKRVVPVERVRLEVYPVTQQQQITEQVRKEQIDTVPDIA